MKYSAQQRHFEDLEFTLYINDNHVPKGTLAYRFIYHGKVWIRRTTGQLEPSSMSPSHLRLAMLKGHFYGIRPEKVMA